MAQTGSYGSSRFDDLDDLVDPITLAEGRQNADQAWNTNPWQRWPGEPIPNARPARPEWAAGVRRKPEPQSTAPDWTDPPYVPPPAVTSVLFDPTAVPSAPSDPGPTGYQDTGRAAARRMGPAGPAPAGPFRPQPPSPPGTSRLSQEPQQYQPQQPERPPTRPYEPEPAAEENADGTYHGAALAALVWCAIPVVCYVGWALFLSGRAEAGCLDDNGQPCASPQVVAWNDLPYAAPSILAAVVLSVLVALVLRRVTTGWRSTTVGFASAVVGSGVVTVVWSALVRA